jgi:hypothetical protein
VSRLDRQTRKLFEPSVPSRAAPHELLTKTLNIKELVRAITTAAVGGQCLHE